MNKNQISAIFVLIFSFVAVSCSNTAQQAQTSNSAVVTKANTNSPIIASSHGAAQSATPPVSSTAATGNSNSAAPKAPMMTGNATPIDTTEYDAEVAKTEKEFKAKSKDEKAKIALADAYAKRAFALTEAAQYRAALGDFRRALKLDPASTEAKAMHDQIVSIFQSMGREVPAEGSEPPPMPFKKGA
jgi:tetratricopeptide (TPR) repeat protein